MPFPPDRLWAMTRDIEARVEFKKRNIWIHATNGKKCMLRQQEEYKNGDIRDVVGQLRISKEAAQRHFPELF